MLKINNIKLKKYRVPLLLFAISISGIFLFQYLIFTPSYSSAKEISTQPITPPVTLPDIDGTIAEADRFGTAEQGYKTYLQEIDLKYCQSLPVGTTGQLADGRDGKIYWSSTANNASNAYLLHFSSSGVSPSDNDHRYFGFSVRCVAR